MKITYALLKEPNVNHPDITIPVKVIKILWVTNEAYVQGTEERVFVTDANNLIFEGVTSNEIQK